MNRRQALLSAAAVMVAGTVPPTPTSSQTSPPAQAFSADDLARRSIERRAVEAVIWGMPAVNYNLMYQEMVHKAKGDFNQIVYWSRLLDWKNQTLTPNPDVIYLMPFFNTKDVGPVVLEVPPADDGLFNGSIARGTAYTLAFFSAKHLGESQYYLLTGKDKDGKPLEGKSAYRLWVPANAPVTQYWSMTVYDRDTHAFIRNAPRVGRSSQSPGLQKNADGSADIYFGPSAPASQETNWVPTNPNGGFEVLARFYGPQKPLFDKTWRLPDIERVAAQ